MSKVKKKGEVDFEKSVLELEKIVGEMEQGNLTLEVSLEQFAQAIQLLQHCKKTLKNARQRIQILLNKGQKDILVPFVVNEECV